MGEKIAMQNRRKRKRLSYERRYNLMGYVFCSPFLVGLVLVFLNTMVRSFAFSLNDVVTGTNGYTLVPKGFEYYNYALFVDPEFVRNLVNSTGGLLKDLLIILIYSLFIAVLLNTPIKGKTVFRAIFFLPVITATGIIGSMELSDAITQSAMNVTSHNLSSLSSDETLNLFVFLQNILSAVNINSTLTQTVLDAVNNIYIIVTRSGVQIIIFFAGLQAISPSIYEAAYVEGCGPWERFWKITLPMVSPLMLVNTVWTVVDYFLNPANAVMLSITGRFNSGQYGLSAAMSFINFIVVGVMVALLLFIINRFVFYENR